jgi:hypothetical protein
VPDWFTTGLPWLPLDGEFWIDRKMFQRTVGIVRQDKTDKWKQVRFLIFDAPEAGGGFEQRIGAVEQLVRTNQPAYVSPRPPQFFDWPSSCAHGRFPVTRPSRRAEKRGCRAAAPFGPIAT